MHNTLKKFISAFVSLTTIVSSVGVGALALPGVASAATLSGGDLIKASGPAVYYYAADGKRYVFPNERTYKSWYKDFSGVKTISDAELAAIMIGGNVTTRPGTYLVKITTDPKTYAVTSGGQLHWIESEAVAKALYGMDWAKRVVDVPDAFFVNYTVGSSISTNVHPDGTLIQYSGDPAWYIVWGGMKRKLASDAAAAANGLNTTFAVMTTITYGNGADISGREDALATTAGSGSSSSSSGGALTATLASDTPAGMTVPKNSSSVALAKFTLTAGSSDVTVNGLRVHRVGAGLVGDFSNVYLYDGNGRRLTTGRTINSTTHLVEFNSLNATVKAGTSWSAVVYGDFSGSGATVGSEHAFQVDDAASVLVSGSATVAGNFPLKGNTFRVGSSSSARVDVQKGTQPSNPTIGATNVEVSNFKITANTNDVELRQITLYQAGSITNGDLKNLKLYQGSTLVATDGATVAADGHTVLKFDPPYVIGNGTTKVFSLHGDVGGRAGRTIRTYVEYTTDVTAIDKVYGAGAQICTNSSASGCSSSSGNFDGTSSNYIEVTTQGGQLTNSFNGPATSNVAKGKLSVPLYQFALTSPDNTLEIRNLRFTLAKTSGSASTCYIVGSANTAYFRSLKIKNMDNGQTIASKDLTTTSASQTSQSVTFTDTFNITAGQTLNLAFVADLSNSEDASGEFFNTGACAYQVTFAPFQSNDIRVVDTGEFLSLSKVVPNDTVAGNAQTVKSSGLSIALSSNPVSGTLVKKQSNVAIAGLTLTAAAQSDITITSLTLTGQAALALSGNAFGSSAAKDAFSQRVTSLKLMDGATQVGLAKAPETSGGTAQISNMNLVIPKGTTKSLMVVATFSSTASSSSPFDQIAVGINAAADVNAQDGDSNTVTPSLSSGVTGQIGASPSVKQTILNSGTLSVQADSHPVSNIVVAGKDAWMPFAQYKATAQYEDIKIDRIAVVASGTTSNSDAADFAMVAIASNGAVKGSDLFSSGATSTKDIDLSANNLTVPKDGSLQFQVWVKLANVQASSSVNGATTGVARSGHAPLVGLNSGLVTGEWDSNYASKLNVRTTGAASGERIYAASGAANGNIMVLRKTQPVVTKQTLSSATLANVDQDLMRFQVSADSAGSVAWKQASFSISKSSAVGLANFRLRRGSSDIDTSILAITNATSGADLVTGSVVAGVNSAIVVVAFKPGQEESISGSGNVYTLHATVSGAASGQNVTTQFYRDPTNSLVTGYLANGAFSTWASSANIFNIDTASSPDGTANATGTFVWADNSEVPHSSALGTASGSMDWTNDLYVQDLSQSQTVSL